MKNPYQNTYLLSDDEAGISSYSHVGRRERRGPGCLKHWHWEFPADRRTAFPFQRHVVTRTVLQQHHQQGPFL